MIAARQIARTPQKVLQLDRYSALLWTIIALGAIFRLAHFLHNPSLWVDEAGMANNIISRPFAELNLPSDSFTAAPIGFLVLLKSITLGLGNGEMALRLVPVLSGIGSLFLLAALVKQHLRPNAGLIALALFAASTPLVRFSNQVKPYASDVLITLAILLIATKISRSERFNLWLIGFTVVGALSIWLSYTAACVLAGTGLVLAVSAMVRRDWSKTVKLGLMGGVWLLSILVMYETLDGVIDPGFVEGFKATFAVESRFPPLPPTSMSDLNWYMTNLFDLFEVPAGVPFVGLAGLLFLLGCVAFKGLDKQSFFLLLMPIAVTFAIASQQIYPFSGRFVLFLAPIAFIFIAQGAVYLAGLGSGIGNRGSTVAATVIVGLLLLHPVSGEMFRLVEPRGTEEIRPVLENVIDHREETDKLYVYYGARKAFTYYATTLNLDDNSYIMGSTGIADRWVGLELDNFLNDLDQLKGSPRVWVLFSNVHANFGINEEQFFLYYLDLIGDRLDSYRVKNAVVYLYDLSDCEARGQNTGSGECLARLEHPLVNRGTKSPPSVESTQTLR